MKVANMTIPGGGKSLKYRPKDEDVQHRLYRHLDAILMGLGKVVEDNRKLSVTLYVMTTVAYRDRLMLNSLDTSKHAELSGRSSP